MLVTRFSFTSCNCTEHDERLHAVLQRLQEKGLTLNTQKCIFGQPTLKYLGYIFSNRGISPDPSKVEDVHEAMTPRNTSEVRSLLGLANYCQRFIPEFATITEPLRDLMKKSTKQALTAETFMPCFDPKKDTEVIVDASPVGLGAILTQCSEEDVKIIRYTSRALTVVFGCEKFHVILFGNPFVVITKLHTGKWHKLLTNVTPAGSPFRVSHQIKND